LKEEKRRKKKKKEGWKEIQYPSGKNITIAQKLTFGITPPNRTQ